MVAVCEARPNRCRAVVVRLLSFFALLSLCHSLVADDARSSEIHKASTSQSARRAAIKAMPVEKLSPKWKRAVAEVVNNASIYRRLPAQVVECDPKLYDFLLKHPELLVNIWEVMGISNVALDRTGKNTFAARDGEGTKAKLATLQTTAESQLVFAEGLYQGPLFRKPVRAECVILLRHGFLRETNGRYYVTAVLDTFIKLDHAGVEVLAKTFQPFIGRVADHNFRETMAFIGSLSRIVETRPEKIERLAKKLNKVTPEVREEFVAISVRMSESSPPSSSKLRSSLKEPAKDDELETRLVQRNEPLPIARRRP